LKSSITGIIATLLPQYGTGTGFLTILEYECCSNSNLKRSEDTR